MKTKLSLGARQYIPLIIKRRGEEGCGQEQDVTIPDEVNKVGHMAVQNRVLNVQQPAIKAIEECNVGQLHRCGLCTLLCPQQQLTKDGPSLPLCDKSTQDLQCIQQIHSSGRVIRLPQRPFWQCKSMQ